jgi:hypothetical protein
MNVALNYVLSMLPTFFGGLVGSKVSCGDIFQRQLILSARLDWAPHLLFEYLTTLFGEFHIEQDYDE